VASPALAAPAAGTSPALAAPATGASPALAAGAASASGLAAGGPSVLDATRTGLDGLAAGWGAWTPTRKPLFLATPAWTAWLLAVVAYVRVWQPPLS
jgi:hypothetical protein